MHPKDTDGMANSVDPDLSAPNGSRSALFAQFMSFSQGQSLKITKCNNKYCQTKTVVSLVEIYTH